MNWLDRTIGWFNPVAGDRRVAARMAMDVRGRAYDAARQDRRTANWRTPGTSANNEVAASEEIVRNRSRDLVRNNGFAQQIVETYADHVVGTGIVGAPTGLKGRNAKKVAADYRAWSEECDYDDDQDLNGLTWGAAKGMAESGASIVRFRRQVFDAKATVAPLKLQVLEPDFLDPLKTATLAAGWIDRGIEYDAGGRKVAYWLLPAHPGDVASWRSRRLESERVPADEVVYLYAKQRPGQDRGMPILAPAVMTLQDLRSYMDAELVRKRIASCMAGFIHEKADGEANIKLSPTDAAASAQRKFGRLTEKFEPGMMTRLFPGEDITMATPPNAPGIAEAAQFYLREAAAAAGVMYEHATGDFSGVNYSSWRAGHHGFRRRMERIQWLVVIHKLLRVVARRYHEAAKAADLLPVASFGWRWTPPGFISVDPYKDAQADLANLRMGKVTLSQLVEERGYDYLEFLAQYAEDLKNAEIALGAGVMFDGDPRKAAKGAAAPEKADNDQTDAAQAA